MLNRHFKKKIKIKKVIFLPKFQSVHVQLNWHKKVKEHMSLKNFPWDFCDDFKRPV